MHGMNMSCARESAVVVAVQAEDMRKTVEYCNFVGHADNLAEVSVGILCVVEHTVHLLTLQNAKATFAGRPQNLRNIEASKPVLAVFTMAPEMYGRRPLERHR